ncbi:beta strand repeat-containing protein, partial [Methanobrevibacter arboriphilus]
MFTINRLFKPIIFVICVLFIFLALSSASAANHNFTTANNTQQFQNVINNDNDNELLISFANGEYSGWGQLNISRNATIVGKNRGGAKFTTSSGTLFNITATNVKIINLTISGYATAIKSNCSDLTVSDNNITTSGFSINLSSSGSANPITGVVIKDNIIKSSISTDYSGVVSLFGKSTDKTVFDVLFSGNNITGGRSGVYLGDGSTGSPVSSANLVFENNNITGTSRGVYLLASYSKNISITFANNNITGTFSTGVDLGAYSSNNTNITFANNNITGTLTGVYLSTSTNKNISITFANNNITTASEGVTLIVTISNNTNITFANNNITGTSRGVYLGAERSNNTNITFANNNIIGKSSNGVYLGAYSSNNTNITFANNNITGTSDGVFMRAYTDNNTNITFANNNITGTSGPGVDLFASSSNNTNITFANNNITGVNYGVYVLLYNGNVKGVNFLNNTINATNGDGFYFYNDDGVTNATDFIIRGNTIFATNAGLNFTGLSVGSLVNVTVEYNRIIASVGVNITGHNDNSSFDRNWWGVNDITGMILGVDTLNHFILNITNTSSLDGVHFGDNVSFMLLVLNTTLSNDGVEFLPDFVVNGTFNGADFNSSRVDGFVYNATATAGVQTLAATLDNVDDTVAFNAQLTTNSSIIVSNDPVSIGNNVTISGQLDNFTGIAGVNVTVDGNLYTDVSVNGTGGWNFNYTTNRTGTITVTVSYVGNDNYTGFTNSTSFEVLRNSTNSSIIVASVQIGTNVIISGELEGYVGNGSDILTVSVDGNVYNNVTINSTGGWSLNYTTNRTGNITVNVTYAGNYNYTAFTNSTTFEVVKNSTNSSIIVASVQIGTNANITGELEGYVGNGSDSLTVSVDGNVYNNVTINSNGGWSLNYTTNRTGNITVTVSYAGNDNYTGFTNATSFTVNLNDTNSTIIVNLDSVNIGNNVTISGQLVG